MEKPIPQDDRDARIDKILKKRDELRRKAVADAEKQIQPGKSRFDLEELRGFYNPGDTWPGGASLPWAEETVLTAQEIYYLKQPELKNMEELGKYLADLQAHSAG